MIKRSDIQNGKTMADLRAEFEIWFTTVNTRKHYGINKCIACLVEVSEYALSRNLSKFEFFSIDEPKEFKRLAETILINEHFWAYYNKKTTYSDFWDIRLLYNDFLEYRAKKATSAHAITNDETNKGKAVITSEKMTIVDAIACVLKNSPPSTVKEIYDNIVLRGLYSFGAKNPISVVATEIMRHCDNQHTYALTCKIKRFRIAGERDGQWLFANIEVKPVYNENKEVVRDVDFPSMGQTVDNCEKQRVIEIFRKHFPQGIRLQFRDLRRLKTAYQTEYSTDLSLNDAEISEIIKFSGIETEQNKFTHIDNLLCGITIDEIETFISEQYDLGANRIWIDPLFNYFHHKLGLAVSANLLAEIIMKHGKQKYRRCNGDQCIVYSSAYKTLDGQKVEISQAIANLLKREGTNLSLEEIESKLPVYPPLSLKKCLKTNNSNYIIELPDKTFAHIGCVYITSDELTTAKQIIDQLVYQTGRATRAVVAAKIKENVPSVFENNEAFGEDSVWKTLSVLLEKDFDFSNFQIDTKAVRG
ncbi:MAG: hypothetical protein LBE09_00450 [Christensenellaceae bacterium]|jgi:restriction system protein|nr:hypothetical protein [Christensenellaceae bacterium]